MTKSSTKAVLLAAVNIALAAVLVGCEESVPQRSAQGGVLSGTHTERQRYANRRNPLIAGNSPQEVGQSAAAPSTLAPATPREPRTAGAPTAAPATPAAGATAPAEPTEPATTTPPATPTPRTGASESGGTNPPGGVTSGTITGGSETTPAPPQAEDKSNCLAALANHEHTGDAIVALFVCAPVTPSTTP
jgi:hypothetical protein